MKDYEAQLGVKIEYSITGPAEEADAEGYVSASRARNFVPTGLPSIRS